MCAIAIALSSWGAAAGDGDPVPPPAERRTGDPLDTTGRWYFFWQSGHDAILDRDFAGDIRSDTPNGIDVILGGGAGIDLGRHLSLEIQGRGTEPDLRSASRGKIKELSLITLLPALRLRWPLGDGTVEPWAVAGFGYSVADVNDTGEPRVKVVMDEQSWVGTVGLGLDWRLSPDVSIGLGLQSFIHPDDRTRTEVYDAVNRLTFRDRTTTNLTSLAATAHIRVYPGQSAAEPGGRRWLLGAMAVEDHDRRRAYLGLTGGHWFIDRKDFGGGVELAAPGDFNATLGGALGMTWNRNWATEIQLLNAEPNLGLGPIGKFAELSTFLVMPSLRFRHPMLKGRLLLTATAGIGVAFFNVNDKRDIVDSFGGTTTTTPALTIEDHSVAGTLGAGIEYFLNRHLSVGLMLPFHVLPDVGTRVTQRGKKTVDGHVNLSGLAPSLEIRVYLP